MRRNFTLDTIQNDDEENTETKSEYLADNG